MNPEPSRNCPHCAEPIKATAQLCPHCRQWLTFRTLRNPAVACWLFAGFALVTWMVSTFTYLVSIRHSFTPRPFYYESPNHLRLTESRMSWRVFDSGLRIVLTGVLTNESNVPWERVEFEGRFFDTNGVMVDVANRFDDFTVPPHDETAFRIYITPGRDANSYASYRLSVVGAQNANKHY
jgi:hypothetical protein